MRRKDDPETKWFDEIAIGGERHAADAEVGRTGAELREMSRGIAEGIGSLERDVGCVVQLKPDRCGHKGNWALIELIVIAAEDRLHGCMPIALRPVELERPLLLRNTEELLVVDEIAAGGRIGEIRVEVFGVRDV